MLHLKIVLFFTLLIAPFLGFSQNTLTVNAENVVSSDGYIAVGVYAKADDFLKEGKAFAGTFETSKKGTTTITIPNLPDGTYAISIFHDGNGNKILDTNFLGIPKESCAFSNAKMKTFGPPNFEECHFVLAGDYTITIPF